MPTDSRHADVMPPADERAKAFRRLLQHIPPEDLPGDDELLSAERFEERLERADPAPYSLLALGDVMLGGRARKVLDEHGPDYTFAAVRPLLRRSAIVLGNLEGPFARHAPRLDRRYSYRVNPALAAALKRAGVHIMNLANNHLTDCGRAGVLETLKALDDAGVGAIGAGIDERAAHQPFVQLAGSMRIGLLGYYWNQRTAATAESPGSAMDPPEALMADIARLRACVDRVVVTFHWGVPYASEPSPEDRAKARFSIDCGADAVIGHHPHIVQPLEIYRGRPILYSIGNFMLGSGNSRAEGLLAALRFERDRTRASLFPLYVKNRDPRVHYQPKALTGRACERRLQRLIDSSGESGRYLRIKDGRGELDLPRIDLSRIARPNSDESRHA